MPFPTDVLAWTFVTLLSLVVSGMPAPVDLPVGAGAGADAIGIGATADARQVLGLAVPFTEWSAADNAGRRDSVRPRTTRHRPPVRIANAQATSRARSTNAERLRFLPSLAGSRIGVLSAGHTSLPPPNSQV